MRGGIAWFPKQLLQAPALVVLTLVCLLGCGSNRSDSNRSDSQTGVLHQKLTGAEWPAEALVVTNSVHLDQRGTFVGDVAVTRASSDPVLARNSELVLDIDSVLTGNVRADTLYLGDRARVVGSAGYNGRSGSGTITGTVSSPLPLPLPIVVPPLPVTTPGSVAVTLASNEVRTLAAGNYAAVTVNQGNGGSKTRLRLSGGAYRFASLGVATDAEVQCLSACEVRVNGRVAIGARSSFGPASVPGLGPGNVLLVRGSNGSSGPLGTPASVMVDNDASLRAYVLAPNGTLRVGHRVPLQGKFVAKDAWIGIDSDAEGQQLPVITSGPVSQEVWEHQPASFTVSATGPNLTYRWRKNGANIPGATANILHFQSAQLSDQGTYDVVLSNAGGSVVSNPATLTVIPCQATDNTCNDIDDDCDGLVDEDVSDGNDCTEDECDASGTVTSSPSPSETPCASATSSTGSAICDGMGTCQSVIRITTPFGDGRFVLPTFDVAGIVTTDGATEVYVGGQQMDFDGRSFSGALTLAPEGSHTLAAVALGPGGVIATLDFDVVVDSTPIELVVSAAAQPDRSIQQPPASGGLTGFVFQLSEPVDPASFSIEDNVRVRSEATFSPQPPTPSPSEFIQAASFSDGGTVLVLSVKADAVVPGVTYWVVLDTRGLVLAGSGAVVGSTERPEESVVRVTVLERGQDVPHVIGANPLPGAVDVSPHDEIRIAFSEQMNAVEYQVSVNGSASLIDTRLSLSHQLSRTSDGAYRSLLRGRSRDGLLINAEYVVSVDALGSSDASGQPLGQGVTYAFDTGSVRIDEPDPGSAVEADLVLRGVVASDAPSAVTIMFLDDAGHPLFPAFEATRAAGGEEAGTPVDDWEATVPVPAEAASVVARSGTSADTVAVIRSPLAVALPTPTIAPEDVKSGSGTETDPYVVLRDNPLLLGEASLGSVGEARPGRALFASSGDDGCPPTGELSWLTHAASLGSPHYDCTRPAGAALGWAGVSPRLLVTEVESGLTLAGHNTPIPDVAAVGGVVPWHSRGALLLQPGKTYRVDYDLQRFAELDSSLDAPVATEQAQSPVYVRLSDDVLVVPVFSIVWVRGSSADPDDDPLGEKLQTWAPRWRAMDSLIDYKDGYYQPEVNDAGREVLRMGSESEPRHEYPPDAVTQQCHDDYGLCTVQFQHFQRFSKFAVSTVSGNAICDTSSATFQFGLRPTDKQDEQDWYLAPEAFYANQVWELLPPDEARLAKELQPLVHNYGDFVQVNGGRVQPYDCGFLGNGIRYYGLPMVSVEARDYYGPVTAHEFGHYLLNEKEHCGEPAYSDADSGELTDAQCFAQELLMTSYAPRDCTVLTRSQCETLCALAADDSQRYADYAEQRPDPTLRCCITPEGAQEIVTREACAQMGGLLSEVIDPRSVEDGKVPLPTGLGVGYGLCGQATAGPAEPDPEDPLLVDDPAEPTECCRASDETLHFVPVGTCSGTPLDPLECARVR